MKFRDMKFHVIKATQTFVSQLIEIIEIFFEYHEFSLIPRNKIER